MLLNKESLSLSNGKVLNSSKLSPVIGQILLLGSIVLKQNLRRGPSCDFGAKVINLQTFGIIVWPPLLYWLLSSFAWS